MLYIIIQGSACTSLLKRDKIACTPKISLCKQEFRLKWLHIVGTSWIGWGQVKWDGHMWMSYLTSLNPQVFQNIAYLGSFKHFVLICFTCIFATRPSPALTAVVYILNIWCSNRYLCPVTVYQTSVYLSVTSWWFPARGQQPAKAGSEGSVSSTSGLGIGEKNWVG